jgi:hypothetical protein
MKVLEGVHSNLLAGKPLGPRPADTVRNNVTGRRRLGLGRWMPLADSSIPRGDS